MIYVKTEQFYNIIKHLGQRYWRKKMKDFPKFMKNSKNRIKKTHNIQKISKDMFLMEKMALKSHFGPVMKIENQMSIYMNMMNILLVCMVNIKLL